MTQRQPPSYSISVPSEFCLATSESGWKFIKYKTSKQEIEDEADIQDSLEALKEPPGISLDDLNQYLG